MMRGYGSQVSSLLQKSRLLGTPCSEARALDPRFLLSSGLPQIPCPSPELVSAHTALLEGSLSRPHSFSRQLLSIHTTQPHFSGQHGLCLFPHGCQTFPTLPPTPRRGSHCRFAENTEAISSDSSANYRAHRFTYSCTRSG